MSLYDFKGESIQSLDFKAAMNEKEKHTLELMIIQADTTDRNLLATMLGVSRPTLYRLLKKHGITLVRK